MSESRAWALCSFYGGPEDGLEQVRFDTETRASFGMDVKHDRPVLRQAIYRRCETSTRFEFVGYERTPAASLHLQSPSHE